MIELTDKERRWLEAMLLLAISEGGPYRKGVEDLLSHERVALFDKLGLDAQTMDGDTYR